MLVDWIEHHTTSKLGLLEINSCVNVSAADYAKKNVKIIIV